MTSSYTKNILSEGLFALVSSWLGRLCVVACIAAFGGGCDTTVTPPRPAPPETLAVYAVLDGARSEQRAVVARVTPVDETTFRYVQDAEVSVGGQCLTVIPEDSIESVQNVLGLDRNANYTAQDLNPEPGQTVRLRVEAGGETLTGQTTLPGPFDGSVDSLTVSWTPSSGAARYVLEVQRLDPENEWTYRHETESTEAKIPTDSGFQPGAHRLTVTAVDSNFVRYQDAVVRAGVEGGYGVFASVLRLGSPRILLPVTNKAHLHAVPAPRTRTN